MSKHLAKILSICALVVLLPFVIVGVAVTVSEARGVTLTIADNGNDTLAAPFKSDVAIYINNVKQESNTIKVRKNTSVKICYQGTGYNFQGWYEGNYDEINFQKDTPVKIEEEVTITLRKNTVLTAVRDVQTYNITYLTETGEVESSELNVAYNTKLKSPTTVSGLIFTGWYVQDANTTATSFYANFEVEDQAAEIKLLPSWKNEITYPVYYNVNSENKTDLTYSKTEGFELYNQTRDGYTFKGLTVAGSNKVYSYSESSKDYLYDSEKLSETLIANQDAKVCAVWESVYPVMSYGINAITTNEDAVEGYNGSEWIDIYAEGTQEVKIADYGEAGDVLVDNDTNFYNFYFGQYTSFKTIGDKQVSATGKIEFINQANSRQAYSTTFTELKTKSFGEILKWLSGKVEADGSTLAEGTQWTVYVYFE